MHRSMAGIWMIVGATNSKCGTVLTTIMTLCKIPCSVANAPSSATSEEITTHLRYSLLSVISALLVGIWLKCARYFSAQADDDFVEGFTHNLYSEGNNIDINYSLNEDGVVPVGDAFRNARLPILTTHLKEKVASGKVNASHIKYFGDYKLREAGDSISHEEFEELMLAQESFLSTDKALFAEDAGYGAAAAFRNGGRIITSDAATALLYRNLLVSILHLFV